MQLTSLYQYNLLTSRPNMSRTGFGYNGSELKTEQTPGKSFQEFICHLLVERGQLKPKYLNKVIDEMSMLEYKKAFTHSSADAEENYELAEFLGDPTVKVSVVKYLRKKFPTEKSPMLLTALTHYLISGKVLSKFSRSAGFADYIIYNSSCDKKKGKYESILEDVFESFIGVTTELVDTRIREGAGALISQRIIHSFLDELPSELVTLDPQKIIPPKTRLKEVYDKLKWNKGKIRMFSEQGLFRMKKLPNHHFNSHDSGIHRDVYYQVEVWGFPYGNQEQAVCLYNQVCSGIKSKIEKSVSEQILALLRKNYNIYDKYFTQ